MVKPLAMDLNDLYLFAQVVQQQGFTAAAELLGIPKSRVSRRVAKLEASLGVRLLQRSSRRLSLTDAGQALYQHCVAMIAEAQAGSEAVRTRLLEPSGTVRLSLPVMIAEQALAQLLPRFMLRYPKIRLVVQATNRRIDLLSEQFDVAVRSVDMGLDSSSLVQARLCTVPWCLQASPAYLAQTGPIETLAALAAADALFYAPASEQEQLWRLIGPAGQQAKVPLRVRLQSDSLPLLKQIGLAGQGVLALPLHACAAELKAGSLQMVLPDWRLERGPLVVLFPSRRGLAPAVRAVVSFLQTELPHCLAAPELPGNALPATALWPEQDVDAGVDIGLQ
ncbi:DNA-binding transcriptional LysR family regulator [Chromobacterium alkanivorans]|uniref:LysR substrate-binding domain-containing protein n=1 Tax=Chromobacterium TaxID=535 RepID=UPI0009E4AE5A|nr:MULTISPECIES: LysR substrate-binding domain-containing protein [Chromobacterium]MCS3805751.1 DNA-binding transcriptional LysR family regulator [Chromobacterium alkanivorans]MCS3820019.1 DNA-binding transcriptional LysR family regulator [Chromobacterium alkanivorans]MCS3874776.1 DNA-binding transcriptional LysR family regulator [Chromobacterium alkanivorans]